MVPLKNGVPPEMSAHTTVGCCLHVQVCCPVLTMSHRVLQVEELRQRLDEKNRHIEKKTAAATQATQDRNRLNNELNELRDHMDIKDRKINVLQRKVGRNFVEIPQVFAYVSLLLHQMCSVYDNYYSI